MGRVATLSCEAARPSGHLACEAAGFARLTDEGGNPVGAAFHSSRLVRHELDGTVAARTRWPMAKWIAPTLDPSPRWRGEALVVALGQPQFDFALKNVRPAAARAVDFDAELGAQVGDDGGGSADGKQGIRD